MTHRYDLVPREPAPAAPPRPTFGRGLLSGALVFLVFAVFALGMSIIGYAMIASDLPAPGELRNRASTFQTTRIYDRAGNLLNETFDPNTGRRTVVPLAEMSPYLVQATIATEDANFFAHRGVDPVALARALYYAVREGDVVSGGSTIPQQLVKMVMLSPERTIRRKINEAILSSEISRRYTKEQILEIYLNELPYGNLAYGADAAAQTYFGKDVRELTLAEAALLAGLPQLPAYYDPYTHPDRAKARQSVVLGLMVEQGVISATEADAAWAEPLVYQPVAFNLEAPHFTLFVRQELESILGPEALYQTGLEVFTTLDPELQAAAERIVAEQVAKLADRNASNGALVALRPNTGEILALVGSADFDNVEIDGQVNMALAPRQPGSSIKPFVYLAAFEQPDKPATERWTPGTLVADIKEEFPDGANPPYVPVNYDGQEHGMVTVRTSLGSSFNIPAVRALQAVGLEPFLALAQRLGITTLTRPDYGLSLSLGGGEVPLLELTGAYAVLANGGVQTPPVSILEIRNGAGETLCKLESDQPCQPGEPRQAVSPVDAFLVTDILRDNEARTPAFGPNSLLRLNRPAAVKTGTTNDFRDNLTVGYTPQLVTGVWVGNADNSPMRNISGVSGAGPIWNQFMTAALSDEPALEFTPPPGVRQVEVCGDTGARPSQACPERRQWWFADDRLPLPPEKDLWQVVRLDRNSGQAATEFTPGDAIEERAFKIYPARYRQWAEEHGIPQPPPGAVPEEVATVAPGETPPALPQTAPEVAIREPAEGWVLDGVVNVIGSANVANFAGYELQYGVSHNPGAFSLPFVGGGAPVVNGLLGQWDTRGLDNGPHTLRVLVRDQAGSLYEARVRVFIEHRPTPVPPTDTPVPAPTATWTPFPTETPLPTVTALPTDTPVPAPTATWTPEPLPATATFTPELPTPEPAAPADPDVSAPPPDAGGGDVGGGAVISGTVPITNAP